MDQPQWNLIKSLVDEALTLSGPERDHYVATICDKYPSLSTDLKELIECIEESEQKDFLNRVWIDHEKMLLDISGEFFEKNRDEDFLNREIGPYRISEIIGRGGMGTVFKASRIDGEFHRDVAIKVIKSGISAGTSALRFQIEKEILAGLQHPNIAHLYGGGITHEGLPYLVMEYIDGVPIDEFCDKHRLTINERLDLFKEVCSAVHFAHKNLVVHRDLKAQNIYVNRNGIVKILDFGIAKLLNSGERGISIVDTLPGQKIWTPQYAAPEQVKSKPVTIETDIYALGILLYRILTGMYPYDLKEKTLAEIEDTIKHSHPILPSRILACHPEKEKAARDRKTTVTALRNNLQGDLDALISKAIRKEPEHRYHSVIQMSEDIGRFKSGVPLIARTGTLRYKTGKFIRRNKSSLAAATLFLIFLLLFAGFYSWKITEERNMVQQERDKLEQVVDFMTGLLESGNPAKNPGGTINTRVLLERGIEEARLLENQPDVKAHVFNVAGNVYLVLGEYKRAEELFLKAVNIHESLLATDAPGLAKSMNNLAVAYTRLGKYKMAAEMYQKALSIQIGHFGEEHPEVAETLSLFGSWIPVTNIHEAARMRERSLEIRRAVYGEHHLKVATSYMETGGIKRSLGLPRDAIHDFRKALDIRKSELDPGHPDVAESMILLGDVYRLYDMDMDSAGLFYRNALDILQDKYESYHPALLHVLGSYASLLSDSGDHRTAETLIRQSLDIRRAVFGEDHPKTIDGLQQLATEYYRQGKYKKSAEILRNVLEKKLEMLGGNHLALAGVMRDLGKALIDLKMFSEAETYLKRALQIQREKFDDKTIALTIAEIARLKIQQGNLGKAEEHYRQALSIYQNYKTLKHFDAVKVQNELTRLQLAMVQE